MIGEKMKLDKNIIITDNSVSDMNEFREGIEETSGIEFKTYAMNANKGRKNKIRNFIRYFKYFYFPFIIFLNRKKVERIIAWQQFYGLIYAFYCRVFNVSKKNYLYINVFIYREKSGIIGKIYYKFMKYIVTSKYIDKMSTTSKNECKLYSEIFGVSIEKFVFTPFGVNSIEEAVKDIEIDKSKFILSLGRSNRDFEFLIQALKNTKYNLKIICDEFKSNIKYDNIEIISNVYGKKSWEYIKKCYCMVIPIKNPEISAGQTVLLNSMQLRKPIIITESKGLTDDYIENNKTGIVINKNKEDLINALNSLFENQQFYKQISDNEYELYKTNYSIKVLGKLVGNIIKKGEI